MPRQVTFEELLEVLADKPTREEFFERVGGKDSILLSPSDEQLQALKAVGD